jgi:hypothetical protein
MATMITRNKAEERVRESLLCELPYFNYRGDLASYLGQNACNNQIKSKRNLDKLTSLYDLDLFSLNTNLDNNLNSNEYAINRPILSQYFSPHSFRRMKNGLNDQEVNSSFSIFHNNVVSLNRNLENLQTHLLDELDFHFNIIGVTETKISNLNQPMCYPHITGYIFEHAPTPAYI